MKVRIEQVWKGARQLLEVVRYDAGRRVVLLCTDNAKLAWDEKEFHLRLPEPRNLRKVRR